MCLPTPKNDWRGSRPLGQSSIGYLRPANGVPPKFTMGDYLKVPPDGPDGVPDVCSSFRQRQVLYPVDGVIANVTLATETTATGEDLASILFDIDCYTHQDLPIEADDEIRAIFLKLWDMKNRIFFKSLTPQALKDFE